MRRMCITASLVFFVGAAFMSIPTAKADLSRQDPTPTGPSVDAAAYLEEGIRYLTEDFDTPAAYAALNTALTLDDALWEAYWWRAKLYYDVGANHLALADLNILLQHNPDHVEGLALRAQVYAGPFRVDIPYNDVYLELLGHSGFGFYADFAHIDIQRALALAPDNIAVLLASGDIALAEWKVYYHASFFDHTIDDQSFYNAALSAYVSAMTLYPEDAQPAYKYGFGNIAYGPLPFDSEPSQMEFAGAFLSVAAERMPNTPQAANIRAVLALGNGNPEEARAIMSEALLQFPNYAPLQHWATLLALNITTPGFSDDDAINAMIEESSLRATELAPYSPAYWLGYLSFIDIPFEEQIATLEQVLSEAPGYPPALYFLAGLLLNPRSTVADCNRANELALELKASVLDQDIKRFWPSDIEAEYAQFCLPPTPTPAANPASNPRHQPGETVQLPRLVVFALNSTPYNLDQSIICTGGSTATVLQTVTVDDGTAVNYVQLECDGGVGWIQESLIK